MAEYSSTVTPLAMDKMYGSPSEARKSAPSGVMAPTLLPTGAPTGYTVNACSFWTSGRGDWERRITLLSMLNDKRRSEHACGKCLGPTPTTLRVAGLRLIP